MKHPISILRQCIILAGRPLTKIILFRCPTHENTLFMLFQSFYAKTVWTDDDDINIIRILAQQNILYVVQFKKKIITLQATTTKSVSKREKIKLFQSIAQIANQFLRNSKTWSGRQWFSIVMTANIYIFTLMASQKLQNSAP